MTTALIIFLGAFAGALVGLLPGLQGSIMLLVLLPWLINLSGLDLICFYIALITVSQFTGSVGALLLKIPGESSSIPTLKESGPIASQGLTMTAISGTAIFSALAGIVAFAFSLLLLPGIEHLYKFYNHVVQSALMLVLVLLMIIIGDNKWHHNIFLILFGALLSSIGDNPILNFEFATFGNSYLQQGLPNYVVLIAMYAIPLIVKHFNRGMVYNPIESDNKVIWSSIIKTWPAAARGTGIGWITGLIPGLSFIASSSAAYLVEKKIVKNSDSLSSVIASESANNAGTVSCLIPFLIFGIPIIASELILSNIIGNKINLNWEWLTKPDTVLWLSVSIIFANLLGLIWSWPLAKILVSFLTKFKYYTKWSMVILLSAVALYLGFEINQFWYYLLALIVLFPIGLLLKEFDTMPLIFSFLFFDSIVNVFYRTFLIYY